MFSHSRIATSFNEEKVSKAYSKTLCKQKGMKKRHNAFPSPSLLINYEVYVDQVISNAP